MRHLLRGAVLAMALAIVTACAVGPHYRRPQFDATASYKEQDGWKPSEPGEAGSSGPWWRIFNDEALDELERQIDISNENVKAAAAAFEEAQALVSQARAGFWPLVSATGSRQRTVMGSAPPHTTNRAGVAANWDLDIWGQIRRSTESRRASAQASAAALAAARLSAQAALASDYFELRAQDQLQTLLSDIVAAQERSLKIAENRYRVGVAAKADVVSAQTQLLSSQAQQVNAKIQRAVLEHAIAVLLGQQPAAFSVQAATMRSDVPTVPPGLPSTLLERRPDIAEAERRVAAANAQIGVARSAFFPSLTLSGSDDYTGGTLAKLIRTSNRVWSFGPALAQTVFDGGLRRAQAAQARAAYELSVDTYRQTVLAGFEQVEDELVTLRVLEQQASIEDAAVKAAREAENLTLNQYKAGTVPYSSVIAAQTTRLNTEETALTVLVDRLTASVAMIEAVGGGWNASQLR
ncbi:MAG: efflux transporter outer membrane subunit [Gammaproteobacteria bacterium]|nr:MAG: efflux transporter outer membrane subunit [Gammaproteobacteria bacterium]